MYRATGLLLLSTVILLWTSGCANVYERRKTTSLTMSPIPAAEISESVPGVPAEGLRIKTPMRIGLAFAPLPEKGSVTRDIPAQLKQNLLEKVRGAFTGLSFVESIEIVPSSYLKEGSEFESLTAASQAFNLDAIALITYDQEQFSDSTNWSLFYWTLVGIYLVPGEKNVTSTLLEASVVDVDSRVLLLHATGSDKSSGWETPLGVAPGLRQAAEESFKKATESLIADLRFQLDKAQKALREDRGLYGTPVAFVTEEGIITSTVPEGRKGGGGDLGWLGSAFIALLGIGCALGRGRGTR